MKLRQLVIVGTVCLAVIAANTAQAVAVTPLAPTGGYMGATAQMGKNCTMHAELAKLLGIDQATLASEMKAGKTLAQIAAAKGISENTLTQKIQAQMNARVDQAVKDGKLTADQAAKIKVNSAKRAAAMVNNTCPKHSGKGRMFAANQQIATILDMDANALKTQLQSGKSLAEIAQSKGIPAAKLTSKMQTMLTAKLDQAVKDGKLTADQATVMKAKITQDKLQQMINFKHTPKQQ